MHRVVDRDRAFPSGRAKTPRLELGVLAALTFALPPAPMAAQQPGVAQATLAAEVEAAEVAFAASMADRDFDAFVEHLSEAAVFFTGEQVLRGRGEVADGWRPFFDGPTAPFSWRPDQVEVLASLDLAHSSGPVMGANGEVVGRYNSVWRLEADGRWRVVFDKGCP